MNTWVSDKVSGLKTPTNVVKSSVSCENVADHRPAAHLFHFHCIKIDEGVTPKAKEEIKAAINQNRSVRELK